MNNCLTRPIYTTFLYWFQSEQTVDHYLNYLKWREMAATKSSGFPPARPIEETLHAIQQTEVYAALKSFPKGGNLHSHEGE